MLKFKIVFKSTLWSIEVISTTVKVLTYHWKMFAARSIQSSWILYLFPLNHWNICFVLFLLISLKSKFLSDTVRFSEEHGVVMVFVYVLRCLAQVVSNIQNSEEPFSFSNLRSLHWSRVRRRHKKCEIKGRMWCPNIVI